MVYVFALVAMLSVYLAVVVVASRTQKPVRTMVPLPGVAESLPPLSDDAVLTVSTWNLGYAGLGAGSDFVMDGGTHYLPPSRAAVRRNLAGILKVAATLDADISFYQEVADSSPLSYWTPLDARLRELHRDRLYLFQRDVTTRFLVWPLRLCHGLVVASRLRAAEAETIPLPADPSPVMEIIARRYALQVVRLAGPVGGRETGPGWTVMNLHLSAFDDSGLREAQLSAALDVARREFDAGRRVVMGGDWNMELADDNTRTPEEAKRLFWLRRFPPDLVPAGWRLAAPAGLPTVRAVDRPFVPGDTPVATIDGFLISPNVRLVSIDAVDTGFEMSDHRPVVGRFEGRQPV